jgi:death-on-curing family protein
VREFVHQIASHAYGRDEPLPDLSTVNENKLDSALHAPRHTFLDKAGVVVEVYPTLEVKAAVLLYAIAKAHAFPNGNKRMAMVSTFLFVGLNGAWWSAGSEEVRAHVTWIAASEPRARDEAIAYLVTYMGARLVPLRDVIGDEAVSIESMLPH